jgi:dihydroorotate dehydrogenase electron transfer subunit
LLKMPEEMAEPDLRARVHTTTVIERHELATDVVLLRLDAPELASATRPGQYVMAIPPSAQAAATALAIYEAKGKLASILFFVTGNRTRELAELHEGDRLDVVGPLGNGFDCSREARDVAIVAGGVGIASVLLAARALLDAGARVRLFYGARTSELLVDAQRFVDAGCELTPTTDDGTLGERGFVTDALVRSRIPELIYACGPTPMLRSVARIAGEMGVPAQLALEETFGCGIGGCWGCVVPLIASSAQATNFPPAEYGGSDVVNVRICKEGPVFWAHELRW